MLIHKEMIMKDPIFPAHSTSYNCISTQMERLIPRQGKDSNSFLHRTLTKSSNKSTLIDQASTTTLWCAVTSLTSLSYLYIKEWRHEDRERLYNILTCAKTLLKLLCIKHLEFLINFHILEILKYLSLNCFVLWTPLIVYQVFN